MQTGCSAIAPTRTYLSHHFDSRRWGAFDPRPGDVVISTALKAGTTLTQTLVARLLYRDWPPPMPVTDLSPWLEFPLEPVGQALARAASAGPRRMFKSHLPPDGSGVFPEVSYIIVARDPRDGFLSLARHYANYRESFIRRVNAARPEGVEPLAPWPGDAGRFWRSWITTGAFPFETEGAPFASPLRHAAGWWALRGKPNVLLVHFQDLRRDPQAEIRRIAGFLGVRASEADIRAVADACALETMKAARTRVLGADFDVAFKGGGSSFLHKGEIGRWRTEIDPADLPLYDAAARRTLTAAGRAWLEGGRCAAAVPAVKSRMSQHSPVD